MGVSGHTLPRGKKLTHCKGLIAAARRRRRDGCYRQAAQLAAAEKIGLKRAAYQIAIERVARAERLRGLKVRGAG
jgi:glutamate dehydrogenase/leucine dehydrogenase